jgi:ectoine hydroxylase-related dioxygenase (phytanoyl-CoA dioxygenase family)
MSLSAVTPERIATYRRDGVVHIPAAFGPDWVNRLRAAFDRILDDHARGATKVRVSRVNGKIAMAEAIHHDPDYIAWAKESHAGELVARVIGATKVRLFIDAFFCKEGDQPETATPIHHDLPAFCFKGQQLPSLWLALTDVGPDDAPLQCVPGSHTTDVLYRPPTPSMDLPLLPGYRERAEIPAWIKATGAELKTYTARAGDVLVIHPATIHSSLAKTTPGGIRIAFTTRWMGDDVVWAPTIYTRTNMVKAPERLKPGDPPPDDEFPVIWPRGPAA